MRRGSGGTTLDALHSGLPLMRRTLPAALLVSSLLIAPPVLAADTVLFLAESATVMASPDELVATLRAEATAGNAAEAQGRVNVMSRDATALAAQAKGVQVSNGSYQVWRVGPNQQERAEKWQASQTMRLSANDGAALLTLVGALQQKGLAVGSLQWRLARETEKKARQEATRQAVLALRGRADDAAVLLDLKFDHFRTVRLDGVEPMPGPRPMAMAMARGAEAAPPPVAVAEDIPVTATAQAEAVLAPR